MSIENPKDGQYVNFIVNYLLNTRAKTVLDFHSQSAEIKRLLYSDSSGLVDSLTDFMVDSSLVNYEILTDSEELNLMLADWLKNMNISYLGKIKKGIKGLAEEYARERIKGSSLCVLKLIDWEEVGGMLFPSKLYFVDGGNVYAKKDEEKKGLDIYDYYLGKPEDDDSNILDKGVIITKPFARAFEIYPAPYLSKRGVYRNWLLLNSLKNKQGELLDQIIPYTLLLKKGTENLALKDKQTYEDGELKDLVQQVKDMVKEIKNTGKSPVRGTPFDEKWEHIVPKIEELFKRELSSTIELNILAGLGFINIENLAVTARKDSTLNPKAFVSDVNKTVEDFSMLIEYMLYKIMEVNVGSIKYRAQLRNALIKHSPIKGFMTDKFRQQLKMMWKDGKLSDKTYTEVAGNDANIIYEVEKKQREKEARDGSEAIMYPRAENQEKDVTWEEEVRQTKYQKKPKQTDKKGDPIPEDKIDPDLRQEYDLSTINLETAPYKNIKELPPRVKKNMTEDLQRVFLKVFNDAYREYENDISAFRVAWKVINRIAEKKNKIWTRKAKQIKGEIQQAVLTFGQVQEEFLEEERKLFEFANKQEKFYKSVKELPDNIKTAYDKELCKLYLQVVNGMQVVYGDKEIANRLATNILSEISTKNKDGLLARKKNFFGKKSKLTKKIIEEAIVMEGEIDEKDALKKENLLLKNKLLKSLIDKESENK